MHGQLNHRPKPRQSLEGSQQRSAGGTENFRGSGPGAVHLECSRSVGSTLQHSGVRGEGAGPGAGGRGLRTDPASRPFCASPSGNVAGAASFHGGWREQGGWGRRGAGGWGAELFKVFKGETARQQAAGQRPCCARLSSRQRHTHMDTTSALPSLNCMMKGWSWGDGGGGGGYR